MDVASATPADLPAVRELLLACDLRIEDVGGEGQHFLLAREGRDLLGCIGLEIHGEAGLLRSFAVAPAARRRGIGAVLNQAAIALARSFSVRDLYVLTTTVRERALRDGFVDVPREEVPEAIRAGPQFQGLCSATAACMRRRLR
ncbi:MAG: GNAT family N-acetyltransferase [Deltaproteobacteria bacterium]